ncbi:hypothetical protein K0M31_004943 [Melipona bicolor]|uniref:Uncharacterized protein n=1 Tax=Melipona bicolor TaxID=60889 RepID=A0AA40FW28_9HYME|nr:hypothetical protein K0M31_004943 [Melipona bicolor]
MRRAQPRKPCRCPSEFTPRMTSEGVCQCTCFETHQNCIKIKRGKGYFSLADRLCIQNEECATPTCEFGEYMRRQDVVFKSQKRLTAINRFVQLSLEFRRSERDYNGWMPNGVCAANFEIGDKRLDCHRTTSPSPRSCCLYSAPDDSPREFDRPRRSRSTMRRTYQSEEPENARSNCAKCE